MMSTSTTRQVQHGAGDSWALVAAAQAGDREAFAQLYRDHAPHITRYLGRRLAGDHGLVEDLTSETFLRAWRRIDTAHNDRGRPVQAWLTTIARNLLTDHHKSARVQRERCTDRLPEVAGVEDGPEQRVINGSNRQAAARVVERVMSDLPPAQRQAVEVYDLQPGRSLADTAAVMGRSVGAVKALRVRATRAMAARLAAEGVSSSQQQCSEAVAEASRAVSRLRQPPSPAPSQRTRPRHREDRWAARSVAAAVGAEVAL